MRNKELPQLESNVHLFLSRNRKSKVMLKDNNKCCGINQTFASK